MLQFQDAHFQLVKLPALVPGTEGRFVFQEGAADLIRNSDGLIARADLGTDPVKQLDAILAELSRSQVSPKKLESNASYLHTRSGGVQLFVAGGLLDCTREEVVSLLKSYGISNAIVRTT
jgi:ribosome-interacting GTPase 1